MTKLERKKEDLKSLQKWFDKYPFINKVIVGVLGTFCKYELSGDEYDITYGELYDQHYNVHAHKLTSVSNFFDEDHEDFTKSAMITAYDDLYSHNYSFNEYNFITRPRKGFKAGIVIRNGTKLKSYMVSADVE